MLSLALILFCLPSLPFSPLPSFPFFVPLRGFLNVSFPPFPLLSPFPSSHSCFSLPSSLFLLPFLSPKSSLLFHRFPPFPLFLLLLSTSLLPLPSSSVTLPFSSPLSHVLLFTSPQLIAYLSSSSSSYSISLPAFLPPLFSPIILLPLSLSLPNPEEMLQCNPRIISETTQGLKRSG